MVVSTKEKPRTKEKKGKIVSYELKKKAKKEDKKEKRERPTF
jgi:hypothetical protein